MFHFVIVIGLYFVEGIANIELILGKSVEALIFILLCRDEVE